MTTVAYISPYKARNYEAKVPKGQSSEDTASALVSAALMTEGEDPTAWRVNDELRWCWVGGQPLLEYRRSL